MNAHLPTPAILEALGPKRAAAFWLERLHDEAPGEIDAAFREWLAASAANQQAWDEALELWDSFEEAGDDEELEGMRREALTFRPRWSEAPWARYAAAASVAIIVLAAVLLGVGRFGGDNPGNQVAAAGLETFGPPDFATGVGERRTVALSDGSRLTLDTDSVVDIAYLADKRLVRLVRGQAFFEVAHDAARPFRVAAGERIMTALGTRFNVRVSDSETRVMVVEGSVGVSQGTDPANVGAEVERLSPGQQLVARPGQADQVSRIDGEAGLEWRRGFIQFDGQTLGAAVEELNRYTERKIVVRDPRVASLRISGAFPTGDTSRFVQTLTALYPVRGIVAADGRTEIVRAR